MEIVRDSYGRYSLPSQIKHNHVISEIDQEESSFSTPEELGMLVKECKEECTDYICVDLSGAGELFSEYRSSIIAATKATKENLDRITIICDSDEYKKLAIKQNKKLDGFSYIYI